MNTYIFPPNNFLIFRADAQNSNGFRHYIFPTDGYRGRALSPTVKRPGLEADNSPPASAEAKKMWIYTSTPPYAFMA
jgi:hypothetical protein